MSEKLIEIGDFPLWVTDGPARFGIIASARAILVKDEYVLEPIRRSGHWPQYFVDVGANVGAFAVQAASLFPGAVILALEPDPDNLVCLRKNVKDLHAQVHICQKAAWGADAPAHVRFRRYAEHPVSNQVWPQAEDAWDWQKVSGLAWDEEIEVEACRLPDVLAAHGFPRIDVLKLDCEGAEGPVLEDLAATGWLKYTRWIRFEWHGKKCREQIERALEPTHIARYVVWPHGTGWGLAHSRKDAQA